MLLKYPGIVEVDELSNKFVEDLSCFLNNINLLGDFSSWPVILWFLQRQ